MSQDPENHSEPAVLQEADASAKTLEEKEIIAADTAIQDNAMQLEADVLDTSTAVLDEADCEGEAQGGPIFFNIGTARDLTEDSGTASTVAENCGYGALVECGTRECLQTHEGEDSTESSCAKFSNENLVVGIADAFRPPERVSVDLPVSGSISVSADVERESSLCGGADLEKTSASGADQPRTHGSLGSGAASDTDPSSPWQAKMLELESYEVPESSKVLDIAEEEPFCATIQEQAEDFQVPMDAPFGALDALDAPFGALMRPRPKATNGASSLQTNKDQRMPLMEAAASSGDKAVPAVSSRDEAVPCWQDNGGYEATRKHSEEVMTAGLEAARKRNSDAHALVQMGFKVTEAKQVVRECKSVDEAANKLLERAEPSPSRWNQMVTWFAGQEESADRPGKYKIVHVDGARSSREMNPLEDTVRGVGAWGPHHESLEMGTVIDIVEIMVDDDKGLLRGKMQDERWVDISSTSGDLVWAVRIHLSEQLIELGFTQTQAAEAEKRCSTVEGAVAYLTNP